MWRCGLVGDPEFESQQCLFVTTDGPKISQFILYQGAFPGLLDYSLWGSVAEWSKALVLGTSLFGGVGSNPTTAINVLHSIR